MSFKLAQGVRMRLQIGSEHTIQLSNLKKIKDQCVSRLNKKARISC
jgi:hypothetical protein